MATFEFRCQSCGKISELFGDSSVIPTRARCPGCGKIWNVRIDLCEEVEDTDDDETMSDEVVDDDPPLYPVHGKGNLPELQEWWD